MSGIYLKTVTSPDLDKKENKLTLRLQFTKLTWNYKQLEEQHIQMYIPDPNRKRADCIKERSSSIIGLCFH